MLAGEGAAVTLLDLSPVAIRLGLRRAAVSGVADRVRGVAAVYGGCVEKLPGGDYRPALGKKTGLMGTWSDTSGDGQRQWHVTARPT